MKPTIKYLREKIGEGKTSLAIQSFEKLIEESVMIKPEKKFYLEQLTILKARHSKFEHETILGLVNPTDHPKFNQIIVGLSKLISDIELLLQSKYGLDDQSFLNGNTNKILTSNKTIEITIDTNFKDFSESDQQKLLEAIGKFLEMDGPIEIKKKRKGSVKLQFGLPPEKAEKLLWAIRRGEFDTHLVVSAEILDERSFLRDNVLNDSLDYHIIDENLEINIELGDEVPPKGNLGRIIMLGIKSIFSFQASIELDIILRTKTIKFDPNNTDLYNGRGFLYYDLGLYKLSIQDLSKAIKLNPRNAYAYNNRANAFRALKYIEQAKKDVKKSLKLDNTNGWAYANLAMIYADEGKIEEFYINLEQAILSPLKYPLKQRSYLEQTLKSHKNSDRFQELIELQIATESNFFNNTQKD